MQVLCLPALMVNSHPPPLLAYWIWLTLPFLNLCILLVFNYVAPL